MKPDQTNTTRGAWRAPRERRDIGKLKPNPAPEFSNWLKQGFDWLTPTKGLSFVFLLGSILLLSHFQQIGFLPNLNLNSSSSLILGVTFVGLSLTLALGLSLVITGAALQFLVFHKVINPGTEHLGKQEKPAPARDALRAKSRLYFMAYLYASGFIALALHLGLPALGIKEVWPGMLINQFLVWLGAIFLSLIFAYAAFAPKTTTRFFVPRIRYRSWKGRKHGFWIIGFLTFWQLGLLIFTIPISKFLTTNNGYADMAYFIIATTLSGTLGIALFHNWKTASISTIVLILVALIPFGGYSQMVKIVIRQLKLGNIEHAALVVTPAGCRTISTTLACGHCSSDQMLARITGLKILSRIGDEHLLAFGQDKAETRFLLRSSEVISIAYPNLPPKTDSTTAAPAPSCVGIEASPSATTTSPSGT